MVTDSETLFASLDDFVDRFHDIGRMLVFFHRKHAGERKNACGIHSEQEFEILLRAMQKEKDRKFRENVEAVVERYYAYKAGLEAAGEGSFGAQFEDARVSVTALPSFIETEYGIIFKKTDEYAVYSFFVHDDGKTSHGYFRSDSSLQERKILLR